MSTLSAPPLRAGVRVLTPLAGAGPERRASTTVAIDADEPVFAGHYPGQPILPGVCLIDCAHRSAVATLPEAGLVLSAVRSGRFLSPVYPGDTLNLDLTWRTAGTGWDVTADIHNGRQTAARIQLSYRPEGTP